jgi:hypothetical protein
MLDNGNSVAMESCKVTLLIAQTSFKSISGMVELVHGIVPMGFAQTAEFEWVTPRGVVDMEKIEDQLERFADSPGHILHAKIIGGTRDGVVAGHPRNFLLILFIMLVIKENLLLVLKLLHILAVNLLLLVTLLLVNIIQLLNLLLVLKNLLLLVLKKWLLLNLLLF